MYQMAERILEYKFRYIKTAPILSLSFYDLSIEVWNCPDSGNFFLVFNSTI